MMVLREQTLIEPTRTYLVYIQLAINCSKVGVESSSEANRTYERIVTACA
jgi:hypothetical protein